MRRINDKRVAIAGIYLAVVYILTECFYKSLWAHVENAKNISWALTFFMFSVGFPVIAACVVLAIGALYEEISSLFKDIYLFFIEDQEEDD